VGSHQEFALKFFVGFRRPEEKTPGNKRSGLGQLNPAIVNPGIMPRLESNAPYNSIRGPQSPIRN
jgi:hypothetical protein